MNKRELDRKIKEHNELQKVLKEALLRRKEAVTAEEWEDADAEILFLEEEISHTEYEISKCSVSSWN